MGVFKPIVMAEDYWANTQLSVARYYGRVQLNGTEYVIVNKEGKDIFECSFEAEKAGREKAIEPGEPADLIDVRYQKVYRELGRDKFLKMVKENKDLTPKLAKELIKDYK